MADTESAPAQYKQPSRKGKKAWRKNVDVTQIQSGLKDVQDQIIQGGVIAEKTSDELFAVDVIGSADIQKEVARRHKPLKADEILAQRSAVPAVPSRKRLSEIDDEGKRKKAKVSGKEYDRLRQIAYGGEQVKKDVVQSGMTADHDPWAVQEVKKDPRFSFLKEKKAKVEPVTLKHAPLSQAKNGKAIPAVRKPTGGKSYNPKFEDWQNELMRESDKAVDAEKKRLQEAREEAERMERAAVESESDSGEESVWESEWEGFSDNENGGVKTKRPERKSLSQRNKIKRRKEAERKAKHDAKMKAKEQQVQEIKRLAKSVEEKEKARATIQQALTDKIAEITSEDEGEEVELRRRQLGRTRIPEAPLEVVLPDELRDSLRLLKPEGNLLKDRFRSMMLQGKVESRKQIPYAKQKKYTVSEKWSYKDWTLK
ncbi:P60-like protein [Cucurbitaria berberidis CBS 394.84]|uniref:Ribosome biogenesis protein NOP53 n=1 Tax=Cucurbitaria berberidis CBS 394.84 TaxID=1168544 RepID=A0A9P4GJU1_9PLEO|nr:P60-like protein [Cucurbitaria berberidis CBS 394.84]KAF1846582.1 P60-like protein [Cucurbitaria berberidis CBS 394.84]